MNSLALRAVQCSRWRWVDGMMFDKERTTVDLRVPDLGHPATVGCVLRLVREALPDCAIVDCGSGGATVGWGEQRLVLGSSLIEALIAALEAAE